MKYILTILPLLLILTSLGLGQETDPSATPAPLQSPAPVIPDGKPKTEGEAPKQQIQVAVAGSPPFVILVGKDVEGLSVETWRALASELNLDYKLTHLSSVDALLQGVQKGEYDIGVGPISITSERATFLGFTQPYYNSSLGILSLVKPIRKQSHLQVDLPGLFKGSIFLLFILAVIGSLCWLLERRANPEQFSENPVKGIGSGMWMALVTMTTVGYGDKAPVTTGGRVLTGVWMLITTVTLSSFTAWLATSLTLSQLEESSISNTSQLSGKRVAVVKGTTSEVFGRHFTTNLAKYDSYKEAIKSLEAGTVEAVVYDYPVLSHYVSKNPDQPLHLAESTFALQDYGFVLNRENPEVHRYNVGLLRLSESGVMREIRQHWVRKEFDNIAP